MIISASRRTDIPHYYSDWFFNRLKEGFVCVRNPMNARQISRIPLNPEVVDGIVLWTKNPLPMMDRLEELEPYSYYFQFTLTGYGPLVEPGLPDKKSVLIPAFQDLARRVGSDRMVWRYDPVFIGGDYTAQYHRRAFTQIAASLAGCTDQAYISFIDMYRKIKKKARRMGIREPEEDEILRLAESFSRAAEENGIRLFTCCEQAELSEFGIQNGSCVDLERMAGIGGSGLSRRRDSSGRAGCGCAESVDIGTYGTCQCGCAYCYASGTGARMSFCADSPMLCDRAEEGERITDRKCRSLRIANR